jgi:transcriptional regulator with XRE-family HTH domain
MTTARNQFAKRISWLMEKAKVSSEKVAKGTGLSAVHVRKLKAGISSNPTLQHLEALANYFEVDTSFFTDTKEESLDALYLIKGKKPATVLIDDQGINLSTLTLVKELDNNARAKEIAIWMTTAEEPELRLVLNVIKELRMLGKERREKLHGLKK